MEGERACQEPGGAASRFALALAAILLSAGCTGGHAGDAGMDAGPDGDAGSDSETEVDTSAPLREPIVEWLRCFDDDQEGEDLDARAVVSLPGGRIAVAGEFHGAQTGDSYLIVLDPLGGLLHALTWTALEETDPPGSLEARGLAVGAYGALYATGHFSGTVGLAAGESPGVTLASTGGSDAFVAEISADAGPEWVATIAGAGEESAIGSAAAVDASGRVVVSGMFQPPATFGAGTDEAIALPVPGAAAVGYNLFVAAFDPSGAVEWARQGGGSSKDHAHAVAVGTGGSVYAAGILGIADGAGAVFGLGEAAEEAVQVGGLSDAFVARYDGAGGFEWVEAGGSANFEEYDIARDLLALEDGSAVVLGTYSGSAVFGAGQENETTLPASDHLDGFIASYGADGGLEWARWFGSDEEDSAAALATDGELLYAVGAARGKALFGHGDPNQSVLPYTQGGGYLAAFHRDGSLRWLACFVGSLGLNPFDDEYSVPNDLVALGDDRFVVVGTFRGEARLGRDADGNWLYCSSASAGAFVARYAIGAAGPLLDER